MGGCGRGPIVILAPAPRCANADPPTMRTIAIAVSSRMSLLRLGVRWQAEIYSPLVILVGSRVEGEIGQQNFMGMPRRHVVKHVTDDGVILDFNVMAVFENQQRLRLILCWHGFNC